MNLSQTKKKKTNIAIRLFVKIKSAFELLKADTRISCTKLIGNKFNSF